MNYFLKNSLFFRSVINVVSSLGTYFVVVGQPTWGTNDEVYMSGLAAGVWEGLSGPSSDLFYLHKGYSLILQQLYLWQAGMPWYALLFILLLAIALFVINYSILRLPSHRSLSFPIAVATLGTTLPALWHLQHTILAGLVALAGGILFISLFIKKPATNRSLFIGISFVLSLLLVGSMIRFTSFLMIAVLFTAFGSVFSMRTLRLNWRSPQYSKTLRLQLLAVGLFFVSILGVQWLNRVAYMSDSKWLHWFALSEAKKDFIDYNKIVYGDQTKQIFDEVGWSETDFNMIETWQYADIERYPLENFEKVIERYPKKTIFGSIGKMNWEAWKSKVVAIATKLFSVLRSVTLLPLILSVTLCNLFWNKSNLVYLGVIFIVTFSILMYLFFELNRAPFRVLVLLLLSIIWLLILLATNFSLTDTSKSCRTTKTQKYISSLLVVLIPISCWLDLNHASKVQRKALDKQEDYIQMLKKWDRNLPKSSIIYNIGSSFPFEAHLPFMSFDYLKNLEGFLSMGWINQSPPQRNNFASLGLDVDFYGSLAQKKNLYIVDRKELERRDRERHILQSFYEEKYNLDLQFVAESGLPCLSRMVFHKLSKAQ